MLVRIARPTMSVTQGQNLAEAARLRRWRHACLAAI
jgi:hypothetical protein